MLFRRTGRTDERRRRVLSDTLLGGTSSKGRGTGRARPQSPGLGKSVNYGDAAFLDELPRLTQLVPSHALALLVILVVGVGMIAGLGAAYLWMARAPEGLGRIQALDLTAQGSLATWFSSMVLALAAAVAVVVFTVRRFKLDDYHGHYRIWLWAAACWMLMSIDATAKLREGFGQAMVWLTGTRLLGEDVVWWLVVAGFLIAAVSTRLLVDMRRCRLSSAALILTAACYAAWIGLHFGWIRAEDVPWPPVETAVKAVLLNKAAMLGGNLLLLMAMIWHARHVILDAHGLLPQRKPPDVELLVEFAAEAAENGASLDDAGRITVLPPRGASMPAASPPGVAPAQFTAVITPAAPAGPVSGPFTVTPSPASGASGQTNWPVQRKLTKEEKKRLRQRLEQMRQERQRRAG